MTENEIASLGSIKTKFVLLAKFSTFRNEQTQYMEHYFAQRDNEIFNRNNEETINTAFNRFVDEVKGQIEAWSQREFGWVLEGIVAAYVNVARSRYGPFRGRSYMPLPKKLQAKKAIINVQNGDNMGYSCCFISTTTRCKLSFERFIEENLPTNSIGSVLLKSEWRGDHGRRLRARAESVENIQVQKSR